MSDEIKKKVDKMIEALDNFEEGKPLPIAIEDIHFLIGCTNRLLKDLKQLENSYRVDFTRLNEDLERFRHRWKSARRVAVTLDAKITKYNLIISHIRDLPWWRMSKAIKLELESLDRVEKTQKKLT